MDNLVNDHQKGSCNQCLPHEPIYMNTNVNSKRSLADLDLEGATPQTPKRVADSNTMPNNQPQINQLFMNRNLIKSPTLTSHNNPTNSAQSTNEINSNETGNHFKNKMDIQQPNNVPIDKYAIPTKNSFDLLQNDVTKVNTAPNSTKVQATHIKIPPITVVGATNFTKAINIMNDSPNIDYTIKYMSIGTKIMLKSCETYNKVKSLLNAANVEFFSHDLNSEKFDKFILSGIARTSKEEIEDSLNIYQIEAIEIREIDQKNKRFNEEASYIVSFKHNSTNINNLNKVKINYTVPKWRLFRSSKNNITQCRRCQLHGHGIRNCNMIPKCANCGLDHLSDKCNSPVQKCANCKGDHPAISLDCPKRKEFMEMRNRLASSNNKISRKPLPAPRKSLVNFPNLMKSSSTFHSKSTPSTAANAPKSTNWSNLFQNNATTTSHPATNNNKFKTEEIGPIMAELLSGLRNCKNKEQQLIVMFEIATKYIYNVEP